jgi:hypothetical protein
MLMDRRLSSVIGILKRKSLTRERTTIQNIRARARRRTKELISIVITVWTGNHWIHQIIPISVVTTGLAIRRSRNPRHAPLETLLPKENKKSSSSSIVIHPEINSYGHSTVAHQMILKRVHQATSPFSKTSIKMRHSHMVL